jgi:hypothetical protein
MSKKPPKRGAIDRRSVEVDRIVERVMPLLAGRAPEVQGGILGDLVAIFIAGHHPALREEMLSMHINLVRQLVPVNEAAMREAGRIPADWSPQ